jgi:hypothetical protein
MSTRDVMRVLPFVKTENVAMFMHSKELGTFFIDYDAQTKEFMSHGSYTEEKAVFDTVVFREGVYYLEVPRHKMEPDPLEAESIKELPSVVYYYPVLPFIDGEEKIMYDKVFLINHLSSIFFKKGQVIIMYSDGNYYFTVEPKF